MDYWGWQPYVSVAERRRNALREMQKRKKQGLAVSPVVVEGRTIVKTFWGKSWCENLERYSDFANRLPRGRTYVRNGSVIDLQIAPGAITALVSGSDIYEVSVKVAPVSKARWKSICADCAGAIDSLVELLQGKLSQGVMERICRQNAGLFPSPREIHLSCSCPDGAYMCKHVAAVLYGVGARFDRQPELLFRLHEVDEKQLIAQVTEALPLSKEKPAAGKILAGDDLADVFGLDMATSTTPPAARRTKPKVAARRTASPQAAPTVRATRARRKAAETAPPPVKPRAKSAPTTARRRKPATRP